MDQSKSNNKKDDAVTTNFVPRRKFTVEFIVGIFSLVSLAALAYLSVNLGGLDFNSSNKYHLNAEFNDVLGLQSGASVEIAGVQIGEVMDIVLDDSQAIVQMKINKAVQIQDDDIALIRTKGIIGDRYIKISRGASENYLEPGDSLFETEDVVDIEDIIGKIVHNFTGDKDEE